MHISGTRIPMEAKIMNSSDHHTAPSPVNGLQHPRNTDNDSKTETVDQNSSVVNPLQKEIMEKLKHDGIAHSETNSSPIQRSNSLGSQEQYLASRMEVDRRRLFADAAALQAAALKFKFANGYPAPAADILHNRESLFHHLTSGRAGQPLSLHGDMMSGGLGGSTGQSSGESSHSPPSDESEDMDVMGDGLSSPQGSGQWTYEEQFKQLYEMGAENDRKQFLDELFLFMQKKGTPVNRIPIMAKQTLDIYLLFKLVVNKGGLVEVINKKLWREITKGLNLPSSITSAAFTLRTQYMKYLYPYECEKYGFSSPAELQSAIDGNRREGRRPGYGYDMSPGGLPLPFYGAQTLSSSHPFFNPALLSNPMMNMLTSPLGAAANLMSGAGGLQHPHLTAARLPPTATNSITSTGDRDENQISPNVAINSTTSRISAFTSTRPVLSDSDSINRHQPEAKRPRTNDESPQPSPSQMSRRGSDQSERSDDIKVSTDLRQNVTSNHISSTNIKITSQKDEETGNKTLVVSLDINGTLYQGVLFARE